MLLPNPDFLEWLLRAVKSARRSIVVVNYMATLKENGKGAVAKVAAALVSAVKRGVDVQVVLEGSKLGENYLFWRVLKDAGADVWMDTSVTFIHTKGILIDDKVLCIGSHNITTAALVYHEEMSLLTSDGAAIGRFKKELERYTEQRRTIGDAPKEGVRLSAGVTGPLIKLKRATAGHAYFLYLLLCRLDRGRPKAIKIDAGSWADTLKLPTRKVSAWERVSTILEQMDGKLGVVIFKEKEGVVSRRPVSANKTQIILPEAFWSYGWHRRLSMDAVHLYLSGEVERQSSPFAPWWRLKRDQIAAKYGFQKQLVNRAQRELMRYDLMEVLYETTTSVYQRYIRYMNYFRQNPLYDYEKRTAQIAAINERYSKPVFVIAQKITKKLSIDSDAERLETLCRHIAESGINKGRAVLKTILNLKPFSWRLKFDYAVELFEAKGSQ